MEKHKAPGLPLSGYMIGVAHDPILLMALAHHNSIIDANKAILPMTYNCAYLVSHDSIVIEEVVSMNHIPEGCELVSPIQFLKAVNSSFLKAANELLKSKLDMTQLIPSSFICPGKIKVSQSNNQIVIHDSPLIGAIQHNHIWFIVNSNTPNADAKAKLAQYAPFMPAVMAQLLIEAHPVISEELIESAANLLYMLK